MKFSLIHNYIAVTGWFLACSAGFAAPPNVLWLGNSLTKMDDIPTAVRDLARATGYEAPVIEEQILWGQSLQQHIDKFVADGSGSALLARLPSSERWDFVVLQDYGQDEGAGYPQDTIDDALALAATIRSHSPQAKIVLYERWASGNGNHNNQLAVQAKLHASNQGAVDAINAAHGAGTARLAEVGPAFDALGYDTVLYSGITGNGDWLHQGALGALLSAMVHYGVQYSDPTILDIDFAAFASLPWMSLGQSSVPGKVHADVIDVLTWRRLASAAEQVLQAAGITAPPTGYPSDSAAAWASTIPWAAAGDETAGRDPDGDGMSNALEYLFGTNPLNFDANSLSFQQTTWAGNDFVARFSPVRSNDPGLVAEVKTSGDLVDWSSPTLPAVLSRTPVTGKDGFEMLEFRRPLDAGGRVFVRLSASKAPAPIRDTNPPPSPVPPPLGLAYTDLLAGFDTVTSVAAGSTSVGSRWTLTAGNCCGGPYVSSTSSSLQLGGGSYAWGSAFGNVRQTVAGRAWRSQFTLQSSNVPANANVAFILHNDARGANSLNTDTSGYAGNGAEITPAFSVGFYANTTLYMGTSVNGSGATIRNRTYHNTGLDSLKPITVSLEYDGTGALAVTLSDGVTSYGNSIPVNLDSTLGGTSAYIGFGSGSDGGTGTYTVTGFSFSGQTSP